MQGSRGYAQGVTERSLKIPDRVLTALIIARVTATTEGKYLDRGGRSIDTIVEINR
jgi:hypothetical protein